MYRLIRILSLDVAAGAGLMAWMLGEYWSLDLNPIYFLELALMVWLVYTTDHLMDARNIGHTASTPRHRFHQEFYRQILVMVIVLGVTFIALIPVDSGPTLWSMSLALFGLIVIYLLSLLWARKTQYKYVLKEVFIAFVYAAGVAVIPFSRVIGEIPWFDYLIILRVFFQALANLLLFSLLEHSEDVRDKNPSAVKLFGPKHTGKFIIGLLLFSFGIGVMHYFLVDPDQIPSLYILHLMDLVLLAVMLFKGSLKRNEWYRSLGDGVFLFPLILLIYEALQ